MSFVEVRDLQKRYGDRVAVNGLSFNIEEGELFSLLGPNGAGKSTSIGMLSALIEPSGGDAMIGGLSIRSKSKALKKSFGVVPQEIALYEEMSGRENLAFWGRLYGLKGGALRERVESILERIGLSDRAGNAVSKLSGGMKRRLNIAAGILHRPRLVFMDEPTVGIDPQSRRAILDLILELQREGTTILYTTHYMAEAEELSDRVGIIDHGKLLDIGTCKELASHVGDNERLRLLLQSADEGARFARAMGELPGVKLEIDGERVTIVSPRVRALLPRVVEVAGKASCSLRDIEVMETNLESIFLSYTGRGLSENQGGGA